MDSFDTAFRSVEQWKAALITLPDTHFFDLMRSIFGNIQSPFNKQRLLDELAAFLSNHDTQKNIAAYIDENDHKIIAAIAALNEPRCQDLVEFFSAEYSYAALNSLVINLEERLILYVIKDGGRKCLSLNPLLKTILAPFAADNGILFPYVKASSAGWREVPVFDDLFLAAFLTFMLNENQILKSDGTLRKGPRQRVKNIFPVDGTEVFVTALYCAGLLTDGQFNRGGQRLIDFARLTEVERFAYCAAGVYMDICDGNEEIFIPRKNFMRQTAAAAAALFDFLDEDKCYPLSTLKRFIEAWPVMPGGVTVNTPLESGILVEALEKTGLLLKQKELYRKRVITARVSGGDVSVTENIPLIAFDSFFSFVLLPEITFSDMMELSPFCDVVSAKASARFKITRESAVRGFNRGMSGKTMFELLKRLSLGRVDNGLEAALNDWEKRHSEIVIMNGISVALSEDRRYIVQAEPFASHIILNPLPGVYLLDFNERKDAIAALKKAGADMISEPCVEIKTDVSFPVKAGPFFVPLAPRTENFGENAPKNKNVRRPIAAPACTASLIRQSAAAEYKKRFYALLNELHPVQREYEELAARIERKLVVSPRQIKDAFIRYERREAKGLDYAGKISLVKQALNSNEMLEIIVHDSEGNEKYVTGIPVALEKTEGETVLNVKPPPESSTGIIKISMGKIRVIRRIKQSIFSN
ncbi:MAG: helicase-associated domain-containing protein [Spirochaetaceae bacterium]|jgi:hypothetical protein|nr:helicase-associated domain-containing protein [Spirochaetaceae bacterium]